MTWHQREPKFIPGSDPLRSVTLVAAAIEMGKWIYYRHKPMHPSVIGNWSLHYLMRAIRAGHLRLALPNPQHPANKVSQ